MDKDDSADDGSFGLGRSEEEDGEFFLLFDPVDGVAEGESEDDD